VSRSTRAHEPVAGIIWRSPFLRSSFLALFISGIAVSSTLPQMTLYLVHDLGASVPVAGLYYLTNFAAPVAGYGLGSLSDRQENRLTMYRLCALLGGVGWVAMALATRVWMPFVTAAAVLSFSGGSMGLLFAAVRDDLSRQRSVAAGRVVSAVRMAFTAGWIVGPVLGSWFGAVYGLRPLLFATAALTAGQILPLARQRVRRYVGEGRPTSDSDGPSAPTERHRPPSTSRAALYLFVAACALVTNGDTIKFAFLPLYMATRLGVSDELRGTVIAIQPLVELALMPFFARLADRISAIRVVTIGAAFGIAANIAYATSTHVAGLFVGQILMSALWAAIAGLGVNVAQQLYPDGVGLASSMFMSSMTLSGGLGGAIGGLGTALLGLPHIFFVPAVLAGLGTVGMAYVAHRYRPSSVGSVMRRPEPTVST
jgi:MFS transporter, SET family, sugar efflux transporter